MDRIEVEHCDHIHVHADIVKNVQEHMPVSYTHLFGAETLQHCHVYEI